MRSKRGSPQEPGRGSGSQRERPTTPNMTLPLTAPVARPTGTDSSPISPMGASHGACSSNHGRSISTASARPVPQGRATTALTRRRGPALLPPIIGRDARRPSRTSRCCHLAIRAASCPRWRVREHVSDGPAAFARCSATIQENERVHDLNDGPPSASTLRWWRPSHVLAFRDRHGVATDHLDEDLASCVRRACGERER
jgi:hypothetical protein